MSRPTVSRPTVSRAHRLRRAGVALLGAAALAACGSQSSSGGSGGSIPLSTSAAPSTAAPASTQNATTTDPAAAAAGDTTPGAPATAAIPATAVTDAPPSTVGPTSSTPPAPASLAFTEIGRMDHPLDMTYRAGDDALYFVSKSGFVLAMRDGVIDTTALLDISRDVSSGSEQGLLGLAFSLDGSHAYVDYTDDDGNTEIVEYAVGADGVFDPGSKRLLLEIDQPYANHNGGQVRIGPDGFLYIGMGDGGSAGDPKRNGLNAGVLLGKMLRIDPTPGGDSPYTIPADNPYVGVDGARPEVFTIGLRNPWRYSFDLATGDLWIADVGQGDWEEIDVAYAADGGGRGENFGWSAFEGTHPFNDDQPTADVTPPIHEYQHGEAGCSVSGGVRYRGAAIPALFGWYVYGDYCSGQIRAFPVLDDGTAGDEVVLTSDMSDVASVSQGPDGELYVLRVDSGLVLALQLAG